MEIQRSGISAVYFTIGAIISWLAVILQLYLIILNKTESVPETIIRFISYFTILTNILVAICFTSVMNFRRHITKFFSSANIHSAVCVYIVVVGLVYNLILRQLWAPTGLQQIVDELLHSFIPLLFLFHWLAFVSKTNLQWKLVLFWLLYPLLYLFFIMIRGTFSGFYPYPFIDVSNLGYEKVLLNSFFLCLAFSVSSVLLIAVAKQSGRTLKKKE
jgi:hypothetical protein